MGERLQAFGWNRCRHCRAAPTHQRIWVAADYVAPADSLAKRLKFGGETALARAMGDALAIAFLQQVSAPPMRRTTAATPRPFEFPDTDEDTDPTPDCFIPVPVSPRRLRERGYNQALLIARALGQRLNRPVEARILQKSADTERQAKLSAQQRQANLSDAFVCTHAVAGRHVGLVDDVMTTGATLASCASVLREAGASCVSHWTVFRTPAKPEEPDP